MEGLLSVSLCLVVLLHVGFSRGSPTPSRQDSDLAIDYLSKYGYIDSGPGDAQSLVSTKVGDSGLTDVLKEVQRFGGIPQTGQLDPQTVQLMKSHRCGVPDKVKGSSEFPDDEPGEELTTTAAVPSSGDDDAGGHHHGFHGHHHHHHHGHHHDHHLNSTRRSKRFILASLQGWRKRNLSYYLENWPRDLGEENVLSTLETALDAWAKHGRLRFTRAADPRSADINFAFFAGQHGDRHPFDGPGYVLAHAFFPGADPKYEGDIHFDADEQWRINLTPYQSGVDLYTVALHELGHSLGLSHSDKDGSVMNPFYRRDVRQLGYDDILAMYRLYVKPRFPDDTADTERRQWNTLRPPTTPAPPPTRAPHTRRPPPAEEPAAPGPRPAPAPAAPRRPESGGSWGGPKSKVGCYGGFDVVALIRNELFIIKEKMLWRLRGPGKVQPGYPVDFHRFFYQLPNRIQKIDAIYQRDHDSKIIMFTGDEYWVFDGRDFIDSPRKISEFGLPKHVKKIDAAASRNSTAILFVGETYWSFDDLKMVPVGVPRPISDFGLSAPIDSALTYTDGRTYFFKDDYFWIYDENTPPIRKKNASDYWINC